jgi:hypothetical protein
MITDPYKIQYLEENTNFSFRPVNKTKKENIKLKRFVTDKIRVEKYLKSHREEHEKYNKNKNKNKILIPDDYKTQRCFSDPHKTLDRNNSTSSSDINKEKYLQPIMKFKPRTDLERIFDSVNLNYFGKINRNLINEQLKKLGLVNVYNRKSPILQDEYSLLKEKFRVKPDTLTYLIKEKKRLEREPKTKEISELIANMENIIHINKGILSDRLDKACSHSNKKEENKGSRNKRKNMNNFLAKNILSEYQRKTHFKALCMCSLDLNEQYKKRNDNLELYKYNNKSEDKYDSLYNKETEKKIIEKINNWKSNSINLYKKQFRKKNNAKKELNYLKELFSHNNEGRNTPGNIINDDHNKHNNHNIHNKLLEDEIETKKLIKQANTIVIHGKAFNRNDLKGISNAVLKECNYIRNYFDSENAGEGKTMITRGMTVNEFTKKSGLPK